MPDHEYNDLKTDIGDIRTIVKHIETKLVGDLNNRGLIGQVHENQKACKSNTESIEILEAEDKKKLAKGLGVAAAFILMLIGTVFSLLK